MATGAAPSNIQNVTEHAGDTLEADTDETTSDYAGSLGSDTTSLKSDILNYQYENGRRYHRIDDTKYVLPNDETEQDRLDMHHHIILLLMDEQLTYAPLENPQRILDVGTGTGIWALDMANELPGAEITGTDITPIQPTWTLPNCKFEVDDAERDWTWPWNHFDLIHSRNIGQCIRDWPRYFKQAYDHLQPGGYIEIVETRPWILCDDNTLPEDSPIIKYFEHFRQGFEKIGIPQKKPQEYIDLIQRAGFTDVNWHPKKQPWSGWPADKKLKHIGRCTLLNLETGLQAHIIALLTRVLNWPTDEANAFCALTIQDAGNRKKHMYTYLDVIVARKPSEEP